MMIDIQTKPSTRERDDTHVGRHVGRHWTVLAPFCQVVRFYHVLLSRHDCFRQPGWLAPAVSQTPNTAWHTCYVVVFLRPQPQPQPTWKSSQPAWHST